ncbi:MAG: hypothetical protein OEZ65_17275, partial [Gemmatimonadota bacterium]|nr:hypothetical protein [Gemmatimonadota bacterium]
PAAEPATEFDTLVEASSGPQPWRRVGHAVNGLVIVAGLLILDLSRTAAVIILAVALVLLLAMDVARLRSPRLNTLFFKAFPFWVSPREARKIASSTWYTLGCLIAVAAFPLDAAIGGILVLALSDPSASYLGRRFGRVPFLGGSVEGFAVFVVIATLILQIYTTWPLALLAASVAAVAERKAWPLDDNLVVPVVTAGMLWWLGVGAPGG